MIAAALRLEAEGAEQSGSAPEKAMPLGTSLPVGFLWHLQPGLQLTHSAQLPYCLTSGNATPLLPKRDSCQCFL